MSQSAVDGQSRRVPRTSVSAFVKSRKSPIENVAITQLMEKPPAPEAGATVANAMLDDFFAKTPMPPTVVVASSPPEQTPFRAAPQPAPQVQTPFRAGAPLSIPSRLEPLPQQQQPQPRHPVTVPVAPSAPSAPSAPAPLQQVLAEVKLHEQMQQNMIAGGATLPVDAKPPWMEYALKASRSILVHGVLAVLIVFTTSFFVLQRFLKDVEESERNMRAAAISGAIVLLAGVLWWASTSTLVHRAETNTPIVQNPVVLQRYYL